MSGSGTGNSTNPAGSLGQQTSGLYTGYGNTVDPNNVGTSTMMQQGQYTPYQTPSWISQGLSNFSQPMQDFNVQDYGVWNQNPGSTSTNGYGPGPSQWNSGSNIYPNYANAPYQGGQNPYGSGGNWNSQGAATANGATAGGGGSFGPPPPNSGAPSQGAGGTNFAQGAGGAFNSAQNGWGSMQPPPGVNPHAWAQQQLASQSGANPFMAQNQGNITGAFNGLSPQQQYSLLNSGAGGSQLQQALLSGGMSQAGMNQFLQQAGNNNLSNNPNYQMGNVASFGGTPGYTQNPTFPK